MLKVKTALISVCDKTGVVSFAKSLRSLGVEIISTGGTARLLKKAKIPVKEVSSITKFPEMLDGRVKTLHPRLHAGVLALRDNSGHMRTLKKYKIKPIDLVVVNLYPFWEVVKAKEEEGKIIEMIDIGGPAVLRAAAKNFRFVASVSDPRDYISVSQELRKNKGSLSEGARRSLAAKVFKLTAYYDGLIDRYFSGKISKDGTLPERLTLDFEKAQDLRYGENPHQKGALYVDKTRKPGGGVAQARKLHGKELSFNNILDLDAALEMVEAFHEPACAIIKHTSPCGFAVGHDAMSAFRNAYLCDPLSAFGSVVGFNTAVDGKAAREILRSGFIECIAARRFTEEALKLLKAKKNLRLLSVTKSEDAGFDFKKVRGGLLLQDRDTKDPNASTLRCVTKVSPKDSQIRDLLFAFKVCRYVKSNAIVIAKNGVTLGIGMGQPSRVDSCQVAMKKAGRRARGAVLASDGFFPKPDSIRLAKKAGIKAVIQPGGSIQDEVVIRACNNAKIAMVFTALRHFRH